MALDDGTLSRINIEQQEWSKSKEQPVINFWERVYYADGKLRSEITGLKFYTGDGYYQVKSVKKVFNREGRRISTKRNEYKVLNVI
jgi:hypothetical protein